MNRPLFAGAVLAVLSLNALAQEAKREDILIADFEGGDYGDWVATGEAFGKAPAGGPIAGQMAVSGFQGKGLVNSFFNGDGTQGTLTSKPFKIERRYINFLVGGGYHPNETCVNLIVDGKPVKSTSGRDNEHLDWDTWDVGALKGKTATIEIVDRHTGGWGHINIDQIVQSDVRQAEEVSVAELYNESYRPQFHFTAQKNWLNDPNGLVFYKGTYHLFFQHNPAGINWGNMTWGHAVSTDLVHWEQGPHALEPDKMGTMFSGSAVVDHDNTAGFQKGEEKTLVAFYTAAGDTSPESKGQPFTQCLAYSTDAGRTWTKYEKNPILKQLRGGNRDPKVTWDPASKQWVMALYLDKNDFALFTSGDLKTWAHIQDLTVPGCDECPDFFPIAVEGDAKQVKWVLTAANGKHLIGAFDGKRFTPETQVQQTDHGRNFYAVQTYSDAADGRRILVAWMRGGSYPQMPFNQQMGFPIEVKLKKAADGLRLHCTPVQEVQTLHGKAHKWADVSLKPGGENPLAGLKGELFHIRAEFDLGDAESVGFKIRGEPVTYSVKEKALTALGTAPLAPENGRIKLELLVDRTSIETYGNDGRVSLSSCFLPKLANKDLEVFAQGGTAKIVSLEVHELKPAWPKTAAATAD
jgi:sucrose-6-phosphate hydrolase SacC (GH32 family)